MDVFVHVSKSAGSTIRSLISRRYPLDHILYFEPGSPAWLKHTSGQASLRSQIDSAGIEIVTGHHPFGLHALIPRVCRYYGIIRDPIERYISDYYAAVTSPRHHLHHRLASEQQSILNYLDDALLTPGDHLSHMLAGRAGSHPMATARAAVANVRNSFAGVAIAERFNESVLVLAKALGWDVPLYTKRNVAPISEGNRAARNALGAVARERYAARFEPDRLVYAEAGKVLDERIAAEGSDFKTALAAFGELEAEVDRLVPSAAFIGYSFEQIDFLPPIVDRLKDSRPYRIVAEYLQSPPRSIVPDRNFVGHVDAVRGGVVHGWAADLSRTDPISVDVMFDGRPVGRGVAQSPRMDVRRAGFPMELCGFHIPLPTDADPTRIECLFDGTEVPVPGVVRVST